MPTPSEIDQAKEEARLIIESIDDHAEGGGSQLNWRRDRDALLDRLGDRKLILKQNDKMLFELRRRRKNQPMNPSMLKTLDESIAEIEQQSSKVRRVNAIVLDHIESRDKEMGGKYPDVDAWRENDNPPQVTPENLKDKPQNNPYVP